MTSSGEIGKSASRIVLTPLKVSVAVTRNNSFPSVSSSCFCRGTSRHATVGGDLSILTAGAVKVALFPATSVTVTVCVTPRPSVVRSSGPAEVVVATPERLSAVVKAIDTRPLFQPAAFGGGVGDAKVTVGAVLSIRTGKVLGASALPALSRAKYVSVVVPSAVIGTEATLPLTRPASGWVPLSENWISLTPDPPRLSVALSATVTFVLFQPLAFGLGEGTAVVVGGVMVSMSRNTTPAPPRSPPEYVVP